MIPAKDLWTVEKIGHPFTSAPMSLDEARAKIGGRQGYRINRVRSCLCCGAVAWPNGRCKRHQGCVPCVVDGCKRTTKRRTTYYICGEHWKVYVPPGSPERRVLNRLKQLAKKLGYSKTEQWPDDLEARWWRAWDAIARRVGKRSREGKLDEHEIKKMFGWD